MTRHEGAAYYNDNEPYVCQWLRNLIVGGLIAPGDVDERSIKDVTPDDLRGYTQAHFFAGIGGWSCALRLAGWPDDRPAWTGSCPCQPFSTAGKNKGTSDNRHLWPDWYRLIARCRPAILFGEQVPSAIAHGWLDLVFDDLGGSGYACGAVIAPAVSVGAPHIRDRLWFVADAIGIELRQQPGWSGGESGADTPFAREHGAQEFVADANEHTWHEWRQGHATQKPRRRDADRSGIGSDVADPNEPSEERLQRSWQQRRASCDTQAHSGRGATSHWLVEPDVGRVAHGIPARVGKLRAYGNAIVPQVAAEFIGAFMELRP